MNLTQVALREIAASGRYGEPFHANELAQWLGLRVLDLDTVRGMARLSFHTGPAHCRGADIVQGGVVSTMLDYCMACAMLVQDGDNGLGATVSLTVNFFAALRAGPCTGEGRVVKRGRRIVYLDATLTDATGKPIASATSAMALS